MNTYRETIVKCIQPTIFFGITHYYFSSVWEFNQSLTKKKPIILFYLNLFWSYARVTEFHFHVALSLLSQSLWKLNLLVSLNQKTELRPNKREKWNSFLVGPSISCYDRDAMTVQCVIWIAQNENNHVNLFNSLLKVKGIWNINSCLVCCFYDSFWEASTNYFFSTTNINNSPWLCF